MTTLTAASHQWATRPSDQRFLNLPELYDKVHTGRINSTAKVVSTRQLSVQAVDSKGLQIVGQNGVPASPTHFAFGQLAALAQAPAGYLRKLPAPLAADAMNFGLRFLREPEEAGVLVTRNIIEGVPVAQSPIELRAATGPNYGRIWNDDIVAALMNKFGDGRTGNFRVPGEFGQKVDITRDNTTIYGSDRDMFVFLADEDNRIDVDGRRNGEKGSLARGFFVWNSEVGDKSMGAAFFLFDYVCQNRMVWGVKGFNEMRLRHTASAPDKWLEQIAPVLIEYSNASAGPIEATIKAAQAKRVDDDLDAFLKGRQFNGKQVSEIKQAHIREEGRPIESLWDAVTGVTAFAKTFEHQDARVDMERAGGKLLDLVAA